MTLSALRVLLGVCAVIALNVALSVNTASAQEEPLEVVDAFVAAVEAGDHAAVVALLSDDVSFTDVSEIGGSFGAFGKPAVSFVFSDVVEQDIQVELSGVEIDDETGTVTGVARVSDDTTEAAGVERYLQPFSIVVEDGLMTVIDFTYNENDAQTRTYLEFTNEDDGDDGPQPVDLLTIDLGAGRDGSQTGQAFIFESAEGVSGIGIEIEPGPDGVLQPAHLHDGDCPGVGAIASPLASVLGGFSFAFVSIGFTDLQSGNYAINVHESATQVARYVSCGEVGAVEVEPTPAPSAPTATPATGVVAPDTGTGPDDPPMAATWLAAVLAIAGIASIAAGAVRRVREG